MRSRCTSPRIGVVNDVVVHKRGGMKNLECAGRGNDGGEVRLRLVTAKRVETVLRFTDRLPAPVGEQCAKTLAAAEKAPRELEQWCKVPAYFGDNGGTSIEKLIDARLDEINKFRAFAHVPSLPVCGSIDCYPIPEEGDEMPLSEQEQRLLDEMERSLYQNDADFVASVGPRVNRRTNYRALALGAVLAVVGIGVLITGVILQQPLIGVLGFALMFGGVMVALKPGAPVAGDPSQASKATAHPARSSASFMDRMNDRWDKRQDG